MIGMVDGMQSTAFVIVTILALTLLVSRELIRATNDTRRKSRALVRANDDLKRCFYATRRALDDERVPDILKNALQSQAAALSDPDLGKEMFKMFVESIEARNRAPSLTENAVARAVDDLARIDPRLAADCRAAFGEGVMALILIHADSFTVDDAVHEAVLNPFHVSASARRAINGSGLAPA